jgi:predicted GIY-YIG superfamily endonuclease
MGISGALTIYLFGPSPEGKYYVGQTDNLQRRIQDHEYANGSSPRFHAAIRRFTLSLIPLKVIAQTQDQDEADRLETLYISKYNSLWPHGYNMTLGGRATRFDPDARVEGFKEAEVTDEEVLSAAKSRQEKWKSLGICPTCGRESLSTPCESCGVAHGFGEAVLKHYISQISIEAFELPGTGKPAKDFRLCRDADYFIDLIKSRLGRAGKIAEIIPVVAIQYASRISPYMQASLRRSVLVERGEPTSSLGRFTSLASSRSDVRLHIHINRHLRRYRSSLGESFAQSVEIYRDAYTRVQVIDSSARLLIDQILRENGASQSEINEAANDALLMKHLERTGAEETRKFLPQEEAPASDQEDEQALKFVISVSIEPNKAYEENLFADQLRYFSANSDKPQLLVLHQKVSPDKILVIEFLNHKIRRDFVNYLVSISPSQRIRYLQKQHFEEEGITSFLVDRPKHIGRSSSPEDTNENIENPED